MTRDLWLLVITHVSQIGAKGKEIELYETPTQIRKIIKKILKKNRKLAWENAVILNVHCTSEQVHTALSSRYYSIKCCVDCLTFLEGSSGA